MFVTEAVETHDYTRVLAEERGATRLLVVAEGAGSHGAAVACSHALGALRNQRLFPDSVAEPEFWERQLGTIDQMLFANDDCGECSLAVVAMNGGRIIGASAGDCGAFMAAGGQVWELTAGQHLKPRLGSADARPVGFGPYPAGASLLLASHGLSRRVGLAQLQPPMELQDTAAAGQALLALAEQRRGYDPLRLALLLARLSAQ
jgi:PPM family protein phosphatase